MSIGCIKPLCDILTVQDPRIVLVTLEGLENILKVGQLDAKNGVNPYSVMIEEAYGQWSVCVSVCVCMPVCVRVSEFMCVLLVQIL